MMLYLSYANHDWICHGKLRHQSIFSDVEIQNAHQNGNFIDQRYGEGLEVWEKLKPLTDSC